MKPYKIAPKEDRPEILLDSNLSLFFMRGRSFMEDTFSFYKPIGEWLIDYCSIPENFLDLELRFVYISTSSVKELVRIFTRLENIYTGKNIRVSWYYPNDDEDLFELGQDLKDVLTISFSLIPYSFDNFDFA